MSEIVPVANFNYNELHFITCYPSHIEFLKKVEDKNFFDFNMNDYRKKVNMFKNFVRDSNCNLTILTALIEIMKADKNVLKYCKIKPINYNIKFLKDIFLKKGYVSEWLISNKTLNNPIQDSQSYYYIQTTPQLFSYLKQKNIDYYFKIFLKINQDKDKVEYLRLEDMESLLKYLENIFSETPSNKKLQEKEIDDLMSVCKSVYNKI